MKPLIASCWLLLLLGCGASSPTGSSTTPSGRTDGEVLVLSTHAIPASLLVQGRRSLVAEEPEGAADRAAPMLEEARGRAMRFEQQEALAAVSAAQRLLESDSRTATDYDALHEALALRALIESNLDRPERARDALRSAACLRPNATLDEVRFPPDLIELYGELVTAVRAEPPAAVPVTTEPPGARVALDGVGLGASPVSLQASPGRHYVWVSALGHAPRLLPIDLDPRGNRPLHIALPAADQEVLASQLLSREQDAPPLDASARRATQEALNAQTLVLLEHIDDALVGTALDLVTGRTHHSPIDLAHPEEDPLGELLGGLHATASDSSNVLSSPWLWVGVGAAVAAGITGFLLLSQTPDPVLRIEDGAFSE